MMDFWEVVACLVSTITSYRFKQVKGFIYLFIYFKDGGEINQRQLWLKEYLYQWRSDCRYRSKAMPHIKTYARWSEKKLFWFILTSANLSRAAWGSLSKSKTSPSLRINNFEAGVLFLPKFISNTRYFSMDKDDRSTPLFPSVYDMPLTKYVLDDIPFLSDTLFT